MFVLKQVGIAFILAAALSLAHPAAAFSQTGPGIQNRPGLDLMLLKLSPNRWLHEIEGEAASVEIREYRLEMRNGQAVEVPYGGAKTFSFDRRGLETESFQEGEGRMVLKYDAQGRLSEMIMWLEDAPFTRDLYTYDIERRRVTTESYYFGSEKPLLRTVSVFDEHWNEVRKETLRFDEGKNAPSGRDVVVYKLTYDSRGRVTATSITDERGALSHRLTSEFDDSNQIIKSTTYDYDAATGRLLTRSVDTYERKGLVQTHSHYDSRGRLLRRETATRERDAKGNWIMEKRVTELYEQGAPGSFTTIKRRKITYY